MVLSHPLDKMFKGMVSGIFGITEIPSCPLDPINGNRIYSSDLRGPRGKAVRTKPEHMYEKIVNVPPNFYQIHCFVTIVADVMFVNSAPFIAILF